MDYLKYGWEVIKKDLVGWTIFSVVFAIAASFGIGLFFMPNAIRATRKAVSAGGAPAVGELFAFDRIADDATAMVGVLVAHSIGASLCGLGIFASIPLMHFAPYVVAEENYDGVGALKVSFEYGKANIGGVLGTVFVVGLLANIALYATCGLAGFFIPGLMLVAMDKYYLEHRQGILTAAQMAQIPTRA